MKKNIVLYVLSALILISDFASAQSLSLKQCIEQAIANNVPVKQSGLLIESADINLSQAKSNQLPNLNGNFSYGFNQGRSVDPITNNYISQQLFSSNVGLSSGIVVYNGLRLHNLITQNALNLEASKMDFQQAKYNLTLNVILAYLQVLSNESSLETTKKQLESTKKQVERMSILVTQGSAGNYQLADLKGQQGTEEINILNLQNSLQQAKLSLCQLMNIDFNPDIQIEKIEEVETLHATSLPKEIYNSALQNLAVIRATDFRIKSAEKSIKIAESGYYPSVSFNANLGSSYSSLAQKLSPTTTTTEGTTGDYILVNGAENPVLRKNQNYDKSNIGYAQQLNNNLGIYAGLNAQIPIFNNFLVKNRVKQAELIFKNSQLDAQNIKWQLHQNIEQASLNANNSLTRYQKLTEQVKNFEESFRAAEIRFKNGVINATEFLIAKNNLDKAKLDVTQTRYEYIFRTKLLDFYQGK